jgi:hypothetical protein
MTTKDYIYIGMIVLTALAFYCNGFYAGVYRCKRMYDELLDDTDTHANEENHSTPGENYSAASAPSSAMIAHQRNSSLPLFKREIEGDFGRN